ncbi:MAG: BACON domain-containing carbohydrate-binding protein [Candidatus Binatia bacterium]
MTTSKVVLGCFWRATTDAGWLHVNEKRFTGDKVVEVTVDHNTGSARQGTVRVLDKTVVIQQARQASSGPRYDIPPGASTTFGDECERAQRQSLY